MVTVDHNWKSVGCGSDRRAYKSPCGRFVVKVGLNRCERTEERSQTYREYENTCAVRGTALEPFLNPTLAIWKEKGIFCALYKFVEPQKPTFYPREKLEENFSPFCEAILAEKFSVGKLTFERKESVLNNAYSIFDLAAENVFVRPEGGGIVFVDHGWFNLRRAKTA